MQSVNRRHWTFTPDPVELTHRTIQDGMEKTIWSRRPAFRAARERERERKEREGERWQK